MRGTGDRHANEVGEEVGGLLHAGRQAHCRLRVALQDLYPAEPQLPLGKPRNFNVSSEIFRKAFLPGKGTTIGREGGDIHRTKHQNFCSNVCCSVLTPAACHKPW